KVAYDGSGVVNDWRFYQTGETVYTGDVGTISIWLRTVSGTQVVRLGDNASLVLSPPLTVTPVWTRFSYTGVSQGGPYGKILALYDDAVVNSAYTLYAWVTQLDNTNWAGEYVRTTTGATGAAGVRNAFSNRKSVVPEQNLLLYSEDFSNANWIRNTGVTV